MLTSTIHHPASVGRSRPLSALAYPTWWSGWRAAAVAILFLGVVAKDFFTSQVGNMLGEIKLVPAALFYLVYVAGVLIFVSGSPSATWRSASGGPGTRRRRRSRARRRRRRSVRGT